MELMDAVRMTDDEIVAIAARLGSAWYGPLPTVDDDDTAALVAAALRGERSFELRDGRIATESGAVRTIAELAADLAPAFGGKPAVVGYVTRPDELTQSLGVSVAVFVAAEDERIVAVTRPNGVVELSRTTAAEARRVVDAIANAPLQPEGADTAVVVAARTGTDEGVTIAVTPTGVYKGRVSPNGLDLGELTVSEDALDVVLSRA